MFKPNMNHANGNTVKINKSLKAETVKCMLKLQHYQTSYDNVNRKQGIQIILVSSMITKAELASEI